MTKEEFKTHLDGCWTAIEAQRMFHYCWAQLTGTINDLVEAWRYADARITQLLEDGGCQ